MVLTLIYRMIYLKITLLNLFYSARLKVILTVGIKLWVELLQQFPLKIFCRNTLRVAAFTFPLAGEVARSAGEGGG